MSSSGREYTSRSHKRKKKEADEEKEALSGSLFKYYKSDTSTPRNPDELAIVLAGDQTNGNQEDDGDTPTEGNVDVNMDDSNVSNHEPIFNSYAVESTSVDEEQVSVDIYDPSNWGNLDNKVRDILVLMRNKLVWIFMTQAIGVILITK